MANAAQLHKFFAAQGWKPCLSLAPIKAWQLGGWRAFIGGGQLCLLPPIAKRLAGKPQGFLGLSICFALGSIKIAAGQLCLPAAIGRNNFNLWAGGQMARLLQS